MEAPESHTTIRTTRVASLIGALLNDDAESPTQLPCERLRWDNLIRVIEDKLADTQPESRPASFVGRFNPADGIALNPQPLPPKAQILKALAAEMTNRAELLFDVAAAAEQRGNIVVSGYVNSFVDEFCGDGFRLPWLRPGPPPPNWGSGELSSADLLTLASHFAHGAGQTFEPALRETMARAAARFVYAASARMPRN